MQTGVSGTRKDISEHWGGSTKYIATGLKTSTMQPRASFEASLQNNWAK